MTPSGIAVGSGLVIWDKGIISTLLHRLLISGASNGIGRTIAHLYTVQGVSQGTELDQGFWRRCGFHKGGGHGACPGFDWTDKFRFLLCTHELDGN
jgi:hypothetical protein